MCILTRDAAIEVLNTVTCAPVTSTIRGIRSQIEIGPEEGLSEPSAITCDILLTVAKAVLDPHAVGTLGPAKRIELDRALRYALDIMY